MTQAHHVPSSSPESNPDASVIQSTNDWSVRPKLQDRLSFIGGSDARIIMGNDEPALIRLWREKRGRLSRRTYPAIS
jgi:predicted phage-related endonuclease